MHLLTNTPRVPSPMGQSRQQLNSYECPTRRQDEIVMDYWAVNPPSITNSLPVMNDDSSEAKNNTP